MEPDETNEQSGEWIKETIHLPEDDFDADDEMDERIAKVEKRRKGHVDRGGFRGT